MTDKVNELLVKWAEKKWPEYKGKINRVTVDSTSWTEGYCETCAYEVTGVDIYLYYNNKLIKRFDHMEYDLATMLNEVLE